MVLDIFLFYFLSFLSVLGFVVLFFWDALLLLFALHGTFLVLHDCFLGLEISFQDTVALFGLSQKK